MGAITRSVGLGGANDPPDISEVQRLLDAVPAAQGGATPSLSVDGICGPATQAAILRFQKTQVPAFADGRIDPGGPTLARLNALASVPGAAFAAGATGSLSDVTRARGIGIAWLSAVEPAITGFVFSVGKKLTPAHTARELSSASS